MIPKSAHPIAASFLTAAALCLPLFAQPYTDTKYGYEVTPVRDWDAVPPQPTEKYLASKWVSSREVRDLPASMQIYVFARTKDGRTGERPIGDDSNIPEDLRRYMEASKPKTNYADYAKTDPILKALALEKGVKVKVKGPKDRKVLAAEVFEQQIPSGYSRGAEKLDGYFMVLVVTTEDFESALELTCDAKAERKMRSTFQGTVKSFRLLDAPKVAETPAAAASGEPTEDGDYARSKVPVSAKSEAKKRAIEEVERTPGWWYEETPRYVIVTNVEKKELPFIRDIARRLEAVRDQYEKDFPPASPIEEVSIVRVCKDGRSYSAYGGPGGSAGYWYSVAKELVFYRENDTDMPFKVLNHEAFHQYIFYACGELSPHSWYNEGYGDYYAGAEISGNRVLRIDPFLWRRDTIKSAARKGSHVPIKEMIRYSQGQYYANSNLCYAQGWSMVYFLNKGLAGDHPWSKILPTYLKVLQETQDKDKAVDAAFEGVDLDAFEKAWIAFTVSGTRAHP